PSLQRLESQEMHWQLRYLSRFPLALALAFALTPSVASAGQVDPFSFEFKSGTKSAPKTIKSAEEKAVTDVINFDVSVTPTKARPGQVVKLTITGTPKTGCHTYSFTKRTVLQEG